MGKKWTDLGTYGRYINRCMNLLMTEMKREENAIKENPDYKMNIDKIIDIANAISRSGITQTKLVDAADHGRRLKNIELLLKALPPGVLEEVKQKFGT